MTEVYVLKVGNLFCSLDENLRSEKKKAGQSDARPSTFIKLKTKKITL
jgi:hypothetical protein